MQKFKKYILPGLTVTIFLFSLLIYFCGNFFLVMLLKSYVVQLSFFVLITALVLLIMKKKWQFLVSFFAFLLLFSIYYPFLWKSSDPDAGNTDTIKVLQFNVLKENENKEETIELILSENADIVMLEEINEEWGRVLEEKMTEAYPYYKIHPREDFFGIAFFSKYPLTEVEVFDIHYYPVITAVADCGENNVRVFGVHSKAPTTALNFENRNKHIELLADEINKHKEPILITGDFNAVPWDNAIIKFKEETGLTDSRTSLSSTFPSWGLFAKVPIDFIFYSAEISCSDFRTVGNNFSDHYGIAGDFSFKE